MSDEILFGRPLNADVGFHSTGNTPQENNLFSATELMAKGVLLLHDQLMLTGRSHGIVHSRFNQWGHLGNVDPRYTALLNKLASLRGPSRYLKNDLQLTPDEAKEMVAVAEDMFADATKRVPQDRQ